MKLDHAWMRPRTLRIASAEIDIKATSLDADLVEHAPWCRTAPDALPIHIKPLAQSSHRVDVGAANADLEVDVWPRRVAGAAGEADCLADVNVVADAHVDP